MNLLRLDTTTAKMLAALLFGEIHGAEALAAQRPLDVVTSDETILVKGTPHQDRVPGVSFCASHVTFAKDDAEVLDFGRDGRLSLSPQQAEHWHALMSPEQFDGVFGPRRDYDLEQKSSSMWLFAAINGGLLNTTDLVTSYAAILLRQAWRVSTIDASQLDASEIDGIWHVEMATPAKTSIVLQVSRQNGRVCRLAPWPLA